MIYTTYYAKLSKLPKDIVPISISNTVPDGLTFRKYHPLIPNWTLVNKFKRTNDEVLFSESYYEDVLERLNPLKVVSDLKAIAQFDLCKYDKEVSCALVCWEREFCHRHLVADWLHDNGYDVREY